MTIIFLFSIIYFKTKNVAKIQIFDLEAKKNFVHSVFLNLMLLIIQKYLVFCSKNKFRSEIWINVMPCKTTCVYNFSAKYSKR